MSFTHPDFVPPLAYDPPDTLTVHEFLFGDGDKYGRHPKTKSRPPFTCGVTGKAYSAVEVAERVELLARALGSDLGWQVNEGHEMDKVIGIYSLNTIDTLTVSWATHRLSGVSCPISSAYSEMELTNLLKNVNCKALFTCKPLLEQALDAAAAVGIPSRHVYLLDLPPQFEGNATVLPRTKSVDRLIKEARSMKPLPRLQWSKGQGARQTAFICASSGTSGLPKCVRMSHKNVIANIIQVATYESVTNHRETELSLGVLPLSHGYALNTVSLVSVYRGDGVVILQSFDLFQTLEAIEKYSLRRLWLIPSMITAITKAISLVNKYDLSSVNTVVTAASPLDQETSSRFSQLFPSCKVIQAYGLTEASVIITMTDLDDIMHGSSGSLLPEIQARLVDTTGQDIDEFNRAGELWVRSPGVMLGYLNNEMATREMITEDGWLRTGDLVEIRQSPRGNEHIFIVDRIKELIKVRGMQVAPAELESFLLLHPAVIDAAVVPVPSDSAGELPLAYVVKSPLAKHRDESLLREELYNHVKVSLSQYKHLDGGIEFTDVIPKTISGKTKRAILKERARKIVNERKLLAQVATEWQEMAENGDSGLIQVVDFDSDSDDDY
ncbi:phenylacetyl-ligase-like protein [Colletotrichum truncatum]|uniref:Phenylacetyl-ligase-like protein n=1 Tax=Colletotrichum truncatum TaxID=5467 RepID=A0ACC3YY92_COLTU|nr:phenylacetyl-ligase-like protein [Colletotrichum truncatum]KAF6782104.1 phenylacetyl-ligase-like protein [Colletotrichum truncatum]